VAATLILYPTYISKATGYYTTPEQVILEIEAARRLRGEKLPWWRGIVRRLLAIKRF
jgi:capsular polysaccharide export protein